jgi:hypothetical protein
MGKAFGAPGQLRPPYFPWRWRAAKFRLTLCSEAATVKRTSVPKSLPKALLAAKLRADPSYPSEEARARAFVALGGGCRATYFNHARRLRGTAPRPRAAEAGAEVAGPESPAA